MPSGQGIQIVSHLNTDNSEFFDTQTWTPKQRCDKVPAYCNSKCVFKEHVHFKVSMNFDTLICFMLMCRYHDNAKINTFH